MLRSFGGDNMMELIEFMKQLESAAEENPELWEKYRGMGIYELIADFEAGDTEKHWKNLESTE